MSRLLDHLKNAERKRRDLRERPTATADPAAGSTDNGKPAVPAGAPKRPKAGAKTNSAEDERYWTEVKRRLAEVEQQRQAKDSFSPDELRALAQATGAKALLEQYEAESKKSEALARDAAIAADEKARLEQEALDQARRREAAERTLRIAAQQRAHSEAGALSAAQQRAQADAQAAAQVKARIQAEQAAQEQEQQRRDAEAKAEEAARHRAVLEQVALE